MLSYTVNREFRLAPDVFDEFGVARVHLSGGSYGGSWTYWAWAMNDGLSEAERQVGQMTTERSPGNSLAANESAIDWVTKACEPLGLRIDIISRSSDEFTAVVTLGIAQPDAPISPKKPGKAAEAVEQTKRSLLQRMGWA